ncbi:MAG: hypothetical protein SGI92_30590 [Bryobacteraceae bacterium]|nr:hypothetical protein [Bryobacteraceae bacterium]
MTWNGPIKQTNIDVPVDLYAEFKATAIRRGMKLYEAIPQALERWISAGAKAIPTQPQVTAEEQAWVDALLAFLRSDDDSEERQDTVPFLARMLKVRLAGKKRKGG